MKTFKVLSLILFFLVGISGFSQSVILDENFQSFTEKGFELDTVCGKKTVLLGQSFQVNKTYENLSVTYTFINSAVAPKCEAKKYPSATGITTGYVEVSKNEGQFIISQIPYISTIEVGISALGDNRGFALYKSVNGGDWVLVGEYFGSKTENTDPQLGFIKTININENNVALKFIPVLTKVEPVMMQTFRIHNIRIFAN
jgi:hypothetical protein